MRAVGLGPWGVGFDRGWRPSRLPPAADGAPRGSRGFSAVMGGLSRSSSTAPVCWGSEDPHPAPGPCSTEVLAVGQGHGGLGGPRAPRALTFP